MTEVDLPVPVEELTVLLGTVAVPLYDIERTIIAPTRPPRRENDAEHSFSLGLAACCLAPKIDRALDVGRIAQYALVHDLVEVYAGDTSVYAGADRLADKAAREQAGYERLVQEHGERFPWLVEQLAAYHARADDEARFVYALDKLLPHAMVLLADRHPLRRSWASYQVAERVAEEKIANAYPGLSSLFAALCAEFARRPHLFEDGGPHHERGDV